MAICTQATWKSGPQLALLTGRLLLWLVNSEVRPVGLQPQSYKGHAEEMRLSFPLVRSQLSPSCLHHEGSSHSEVSTLRQLLRRVLQLPCRIIRILSICALASFLGSLLYNRLAAAGNGTQKASGLRRKHVRLNRRVPPPSITMEGPRHLSKACSPETPVFSSCHSLFTPFTQKMELSCSAAPPDSLSQAQSGFSSAKLTHCITQRGDRFSHEAGCWNVLHQSKSDGFILSMAYSLADCDLRFKDTIWIEKQ